MVLSRTAPVKMDARRRKSRERLKAALAVLLRDKSLEKISIEEITKEAGVTRPTFYSNYRDRQEIVTEYVQELMERLTSKFKQLEDDKALVPREKFERIVAFYITLVKENNSIILYAASGRAGDEALEIIRAYNLKLLKARLDNSPNNSMSKEKLDLFVHFVSSAINGVIEAHAGGKIDMSPTEVAKTIADLVHEGVGADLGQPIL